jgi:TPP-dependent pyruvate/acetoin dehydrogenase alpha subunit
MIPNLPSERVLEILRRMLLTRRFEETCLSLIHEDIFPGHSPLYLGHTHVCIGQEATGAAVMAAIADDDILYSTHRNHGHLLSRGADPGRALAEILGKADGYCRGRAGSYHGCAPELNIPISSGIVGNSLPIAVGTGLSFKVRKKPGIVVVMFGDGSLEEGAAHEALNLASIWQVPTVFVCENNSWADDDIHAVSPNPKGSLSVSQLTDIAALYRIPTSIVDGKDIGVVYQAVVEARERAISGGGPTFIESRTHPWPGNTGALSSSATATESFAQTDIEQTWTDVPPQVSERHRRWWDRGDPVLAMAREVVEAGLSSREELRAMDTQVREEMARALGFAIESPYPPEEEAWMFVWP